MKLALIINGLDSGGAEKSTIKMCDGFLADGHEVLLITLTDKIDFYTLSNCLRRINLDGRAEGNLALKLRARGFNRIIGLHSTLKKSWSFRRIMLEEAPDCIISMSAKVAVFSFFSTRFLKLPQIGSERIHPNSAIFSHGFFADKLRPLIYKRGMVLSVQTKGIADWCEKVWGVRSFVTPNHLNFIPMKEITTFHPPIPLRENFALAISRDHPQKNLDFLLETWVYVEKLIPDAHLIVVGPENTERTEKFAAKLGLTRISIQARTESLAPYFNQARVFLSTSIFEGFPNVILEAISYGIPVITTPSCDLVEHFAQNGAAIVVYSQEPQAFAQVIADLLSDHLRYLGMSQSASKLAVQYSWENVRADWYLAIQAAIRHYS